MKYNTHTDAAFSAALDAFDIGWNGGSHAVTAADLLEQPAFAAALDAFGIGLPVQKPEHRALCIGDTCELHDEVTCYLAGAYAC